jgi:hypothetical protein
MSEETPISILTQTLRDLSGHVETLTTAMAEAKGAAGEKAKVCVEHSGRLGKVETAIGLLTTMTARHEERLKLLLWVQTLMATTTAGILTKIVVDMISK